MRKEYDFTNSKKKPYASKLKKQITLRIDENTIKYFKEVAGNTGISYQNLINLYLYECATNKKKLELRWN